MGRVMAKESLAPFISVMVTKKRKTVTSQVASRSQKIWGFSDFKYRYLENLILLRVLCFRCAENLGV